MGKQDKNLQQKVTLAPAQKRPLSYNYESPADFLTERFNFFANGPQGVIVSGSTYSNSTSNDVHGALDASVTDYIYDQHGVRIGLAMATADGLGHSSIEQENQSTALVSLSTCELLVNKSKDAAVMNTESMQQIMLEVGSESIQSKLSPGYDSKSSLAATVISRQPDGSLKAVLANVGDEMIVVIDGKTGKIKHSLAARTYTHAASGGGVEYSPNAVQELTEDNVATNAEIIEINNIQEKDIILQLTDGVWGEFEFSKQDVKDRNYRESNIDCKTFRKAVEDAVKCNSPRATIYIAGRVAAKFAELTLAKRKKFLTLQEVLKPYSQALLEKQFSNQTEYEAYTISVWLKEIQADGGRGNYASFLVKEYLEELQHDGIYYKDACPARKLVEGLNKKPFGDCATLTMMEVPSYKKELIRALLVNPEHKKELLARIENDILPSELEDIVQSLAEEMALPIQKDNAGNRYRTLHENYYLIYTQQQCQDLLRLLDANNYIKELVNSVPSQDKSTLLEQLKTQLICQSEAIQEEDTAALNVEQISEVFDICYLKEELFNSHRNSNWDKFFGVKNTKTWARAVKEIRDYALEKLFTEIEEKESPAEKIQLLNWAKQQPLFNQHRSNFLITGAWGNTAAISQINAKINEMGTSKFKSDFRP